MTDITLASLAPRPLWVSWQLEARTAGSDITKVPYAPFRGAGKAKANNPSTWGDRSAAEAHAARLRKPHGRGGVGIELAPLGDGTSLGGVDLDRCRNPETGAFEPWAEDLILAFDSYAEISPSQTGAKIFFRYQTDALDAALRPLMGGSKWGKSWKLGSGKEKPGIELHLGDRYFTVTDQKLPSSNDALRQVGTDQIVNLITKIGPQLAVAGNPLLQAIASVGDRMGETGRRKRKGDGEPPTDKSRSAVAFRIGVQAIREGADFAGMCDAVRDNPDSREWYVEKGTANDGRELRRIFEKAQSQKPVIRIVAGEVDRVASEAEAAIIKAGELIYQRGRSLVRPWMLERPSFHGRTTMALGLVEQCPASMLDLCCGIAEWERYDGRSEAWVRSNPSKDGIAIMLARFGRWAFQPLAGVTATPTMRPDGSILSEPGYDAATRLYHQHDPSLILPPVVHRPSRADAEAALNTLNNLLDEFPFASGPSRSVALSALITPVVRGAMPVVPLHAFVAHAPGSGKSYLCDIVARIQSGERCAVVTVAKSDEETEKRLIGMMLAGFPLINLDNCNGELGFDLLCQATTQPLIRLRRLGASDMIEVESCATILATGNNLRVRGDMIRRSLICNLDPQMERPELREFHKNPEAIVSADRGRYVGATLTIVRAYKLAGSPGKLPPIAGFEAWSDLVRSALVWLGQPDPVETMEEARSEDPVLDGIRVVMDAWNEAFGAADVTCARAIEEAGAKTVPMDDHGYPIRGADGNPRHPGLMDALLQVAPGRFGADAGKLGDWFRSNKGRIHKGRRFVSGGKTGGATRWKLETVATQQSGSRRETERER